jgi:hypothetical protein
MKTIGDITEAKSKSVVFTFGRFNPPTSGHEKLIQKISAKARTLGADPLVYSSKSQDSKNNPLDHKIKIMYLKKFFGRQVKFPTNPVRNVFDILVQLNDQGYTDISMIVGSDRVAEFKKLLNMYNGKTARHGRYDFESINVISAGERDPDAEDASGMSASKARQIASDGDYEEFKKAVPSTAKEADIKKLYYSVRSKMGIREEGMDLPEYIYKDLYEGGKKIKVMNNKGTVRYINSYELRTYTQMGYKKVSEEVQEVKTIKVGEDAVGSKNPHYAIIQDRKVVAIDSKENLLKAVTKLEGARVWLTTKALGEIVEDAVPSVKGDQPAKYYSGIKDKKEKESRAKHFAKGADKPDDDPKSYTPAPGDKDAKTKPSKYTKKFKQMFGEVIDDAERARIKAQRDRNKDQLQRMRSRYRDQIDRLKDKEQRD